MLLTQSLPMDDIGSRLKSERIRLGYSQSDFGAIGGVQKQAQLKYEKGERFPGADYLQLIAGAGADIQLIVTGKAGYQGKQLSQDEALWLNYFRAVPEIVRSAVMGSLRAADDYARSERLGRYRLPDKPSDNI